MSLGSLPRNDDASKELDVIKREIIGNPELESQNIYDIINGGNLITCGVIIGIVGVVIKPAWRKSI